MPRINLLPWREKERRERKITFFIGLGAAALLAAVVAFGVYLWFGALIDAQERRNERLRGEIKVLDKQIEEINDLEQQKQRFISRMQVIDKLQRSRPEEVHLFDEMVKVMPDGTYLTGLTQTGEKLKLTGIAQSSTRVSTLMRNISASEWMKNPELEVVEAAKDNAGSSFVLDADQVGVNLDDTSATGTVRTAAGAKP